MIFLSKLTRSKKSKHFILLLCFVSLTLFAVAQTGVINNGAKMIINSGAVMKITGSGADYTNASSGGKDGRIDLDGKIELQGDWINPNDTVLINVDSDGIVLFNGSTPQTISGNVSLFENLTIDNATGLSLSADAEVGNVLSLSNGLVTLNSNNLIIGSSGSISGGTFGPTRMVVTNGTGTLRKSVVGAGSFTFPIGENTGTAEYSPVDFDLTGHGGLTNAWVSAHVTDAKHSSNTSPSEFLSRYWTLSSSGITAPNYDADFNYLTADINGTEADIYAAEYDGSARTVYSTVDAINNILSVTDLSSFADYTGVDGTAPSVNILYPEDNQLNVALTDNLQMTFNENVYLNSGSIEIRHVSDNSLFESIVVTTLSGDGTETIIIDPSSDFASQVEYYVLVPSGAFTDAAGNEYAGISGTTDWTFTTVDINNPYISSVSPVDESLNVSITSDLVITFSENVNAVAGKYITIMNASTSSTHETIEASNGIVTINNEVVTINPSIDFAGETDYYVLIDEAAFEDTESNPFAGISSVVYWNFFTGDNIPPSVTITSTESGTVTGNFDITITFSEVVTGFTSDDITVVNGSVNSFTESTVGQIWTVTIAPVTDGDVTVDISSGLAQDAAGNDNTAADQFSITYDSGVGFEDLIPYEISIYSLENRVIVKFTNEGNYQFKKGVVEVYNLLGQKITASNINDFVKFEIKVEHVSQIYIVKVVIDGVPYTKRLYIE